MKSIIRRRGVRAALLALGSIAALAAWPVATSATVIEKVTFSDEFSGDIVDDCGRAVHQEFSGSGRAHVRVGKGGLQSAFFGHSNVSWTETFTNPDTGDSYTIAGTSHFQETKAVRVSGTIFRFTAVDAGTWRLLDGDGNVVLFDRGNIRSTILFDTLGDATPGGLFVDLVSEVVHGPHPGFELTQEEFCSLTDGLLGLS